MNMAASRKLKLHNAYGDPITPQAVIKYQDLDKISG
jgi:hypothetical protein